MMNEKKTTLNLEMFKGVNYFTGLDRDNLVVDGDVSPYVPSDVKILWFRSVNAKGIIKTQMVGSLEDIVRYKLCVFSAEVYDNENKMLAMGYGSASTDEDGFIGHAERRAVGKALTHAGFTWHNGDFSIDVDVAKTFLNLYNGYINTGTLDINDVKVTQMYDDALVTVLPEGYGNDTGKSIAAMDQTHLAEIAKNYAMIASGDALVNAKIKFVYMYQMLHKESEKKPEFEPSMSIAETNGPVEEEKNTEKDSGKKGKRGGRKSKKTPVNETAAEDTPETAADYVAENELSEEPTTKPVAEEETLYSDATTVTEAEQQEVTAAAEVTEDSVSQEMPAAEETVMEEVLDQATDPFNIGEFADMDDAFSDEDMDAEAVADVFAFVAQNTAEDTVTDDYSEEDIDRGLENDFHLDNGDQEGLFPEMDGTPIDGEEPVSDNSFDGFSLDDTEGNPFTDDDEFDIEKDLQDEMHLQTVLKSWGYRSVEELNSTEKWIAHLKKVRERYATVNWNDTATAREFVENIPIYNNFLWKEKAERDHVVLLGDFLNEHKDEVIAAINAGTFPLVTLKSPVTWYIDHVWDEF